MKKIKKIARKMYRLFYQVLQKPRINLEKTQWWPRNKLEELQNRRLRNIISHAYSNIPYYRKVLQERGLRPKDIRTKEDLKKLPILTKEIIRKNFEDLIYRPLCKHQPSQTGGSTGEPMRYYWDFGWDNIRWQAAYCHWKWAGYNKGDRMAILSSRRLMDVKDGIIQLGGVFEVERWDAYLKQLKDFKPSFIYGYVWQVYLVANQFLKKGINLPVKSVILAGETLYEFQRKIVEEAFQCPVFNEYGCGDGGAKAFECTQHNGLHHAMEWSIIEILDGRIITTDLWNKAQPFIRYENRDRAELLNFKCPCGRESDLYYIEGRVSDIIITPKKVITYVNLMFPVVRARKCFEAAQYIQQPGYKLIFNAVRNNSFSKIDFDNFVSELSSLCDGMAIEINFVEKIATTPAGKTRFIINEDKELLEKISWEKFK